MEGTFALLPLAVLCTGLILLLCSKRLASGAYSSQIALSSVVLAFASVIYVNYLARSRVLWFQFTGWAPVPGHSPSLVYRVDSWSALFAGLALAAVLAGLLLRTRLALVFPHRNPWTDVFLLALGATFVNLVFSGSAILVSASWICLGLVAYVGSASSFQEPEARAAAQKTLVMTCGSGSALLALAIVVGRSAGYGVAFGDFSASQLTLPVFVLLLVALAVYAGQFPFNLWATQLGSVPSSFAAAGGILTAVASIYLLGRFAFILSAGPGSRFALVLIVMGLASVAYGAISAWVESDFKRLLRHLAMIEVGYAFTAFGLGSPAALSAATLIAINLCLSGGAIAFYLLELRSRSVAGEASLVSRSPLELALALLAYASLIGSPPLLGFFARWMLYSAAIQSGYGAVAGIGFAISVVAVVPFLKSADHLLFSQTDLGWKHAESHSALSLCAVGLLQLPGLAIGLFPWPALRQVVSPALVASSTGPVGPTLATFTTALDLVSAPAYLLSALAVVIPFAVALKLYPFPMGRSRLLSYQGVAVSPMASGDRHEGIRVGLAIGAESLSRMFNPEHEVSVLRLIVESAGRSLHVFSLRVEERYYFPTVLLLGIALVFVFLG